MELRDKKGLTEEEFLAAYDPDKYPKPSLTADIVVFAREGKRLRLLLIRRGGHPYLGYLALPGGFAKPEETAEESAARELEEETGVTGVPLRLVGVFSRPGRDPRGWVVSAAYAAVLDADALAVEAGDDAADALWFDVVSGGEDAPILLRHGTEEILLPSGGAEGPENRREDRLAFDHGEIVLSAIGALFGEGGRSAG